MAGAGQPWYMPLTWPVGHVIAATKEAAVPKAATKSREAAGALDAGSQAKPRIRHENVAAELDFVGHATSVVAASRSFLLALACIYYLHGGEDPQTGYPAFGRAATLEWSWFWPLLARNIAATWIIAGFWDWFLYFSWVAPHLRRFKMNDKYPSLAQMKHDALHTTFASVCGTVVEAFMCHLYAAGRVEFHSDLFSPWTLLAAATITHWRVPHFWLIHRAMHPWRVSFLPKSLDPGQFLYRHCHSLHHKSYNPSAFSGTSMHPLEATLYYSASMMAVVAGAHPAVALGCIVDCAVGAWLGHDGFMWPGSGDAFHQVHHECRDCNFGAMHVPMDKWLGTFAARPSDVKKIWGKTPANDMPVHAASKSRSGVE